jgi:hypothetical protein
MRIEESFLIKEIVANLGNSLSILNIGSSSFEFRNYQQPHVGRLYNDLSLQNKVMHLDIKDDIGVDIVLNIFDKNARELFNTSEFNFFLVSNLLEHLSKEDFVNFPIAIDEISKNGDYLLIVQPSSYPIHFDPIDNYFRPSLDELSFVAGSNFNVVQSGCIYSTTYFNDLINGGFLFILKNCIKLFLPFFRYKAWISNLHRLLWLFKPYKSSYCLLQKNK